MVPNAPIPSDDTPAFVAWLRTHHPSVYLMHLIITQTHMRLTNVLDLNWSSVELLTGTLTVRSRKTMTLQTMPITPELAPLLTAYLQTSRSARLRAVKTLGPAHRQRLRRLRVRGPRSAGSTWPPTQR